MEEMEWRIQGRTSLPSHERVHKRGEVINSCQIFWYFGILVFWYIYFGIFDFNICQHSVLEVFSGMLSGMGIFRKDISFYVPSPLSFPLINYFFFISFWRSPLCIEIQRLYSVQIFTLFPGGPARLIHHGAFDPPVCNLYNIQVGINNCKQIVQFVSSIALPFPDSKYLTVLQETKGERGTHQWHYWKRFGYSVHHALIQSAGFCEQLDSFFFPLVFS